MSGVAVHFGAGNIGRGFVGLLLHRAGSQVVFAFTDEAQQVYVDKILQRFANPYLPDTVDRVGRQPLRKLSRSERLIGPAAELAERGVRPQHLLATVEAALAFDVPEDPESVELQHLLRTLTAAEATERITGLRPADPLYADVLAVLERRVGA